MNPLIAHLSRCLACRTEFEAQREIVVALERIPHLTPSPRFADRVMTQVEVFEPWHVAALDTVRRWLPQTPVARRVAATAGGVTAIIMSVLTVWLSQRADAVLFVGSLVAQRSREAIVGGLHGAVVAFLGEGAANAVLASGPLGLAAALTAIAAAVLGTAFGIKRLASASHNRRG
ncbi:MAG: hypothetical protein ABIZ91_08650 [Gemmatimonadaceae bacterium]